MDSRFCTLVGLVLDFRYVTFAVIAMAPTREEASLGSHDKGMQERVTHTHISSGKYSPAHHYAHRASAATVTHKP